MLCSKPHYQIFFGLKLFSYEISPGLRAQVEDRFLVPGKVTRTFECPQDAPQYTPRALTVRPICHFSPNVNFAPRYVTQFCTKIWDESKIEKGPLVPTARIGGRVSEHIQRGAEMNRDRARMSLYLYLTQRIN